MKVKVTDRDGTQHEITAQLDLVLMETLRLLDYGVAAVCGGMMACGTCHVYVDDADLGKLSSQSEDELTMLEGLAHRKPTSRLSCQIHVTPALEGIHLTIAPEE